MAARVAILNRDSMSVETLTEEYKAIDPGVSTFVSGKTYGESCVYDTKLVDNTAQLSNSSLSANTIAQFIESDLNADPTARLIEINLSTEASAQVTEPSNSEVPVDSTARLSDNSMSASASAQVIESSNSRVPADSTTRLSDKSMSADSTARLTELKNSSIPVSMQCVPLAAPAPVVSNVLPPTRTIIDPPQEGASSVPPTSTIQQSPWHKPLLVDILTTILNIVVEEVVKFVVTKLALPNAMEWIVSKYPNVGTWYRI